MKPRFFAGTCLVLLAFLLLEACNDPNERLSGQVSITTVTTGTFDPGVEYLITFSDLVGIQDYPNGVSIGPNASTGPLTVPRVGELLWICISGVPSNCLDISTSSPTTNQLGSGDSPTQCDFPDAQFGSNFLIPIDGSLGELVFTISCN